MKKISKIRGKAVVLCAAFFLGVGAPAFSQASTLDELTSVMDAFAESMALALPFNASMGLNWSDAHIGRLFPGLPPNFGVGVTGGFTTMNVGPIENLLSTFGFDEALPEIGGFPLPGIMAEARIGGFILPFDIGFKFGFLPINEIGFVEVDYFLVGGDFRYALLHGRRFLPTISVGAGFTHMRGGIGVSIDDTNFGFTFPGGSGILRIQNPRLGLEWSTSVLDFKAQVSRSLFIITPYVGLGASHGWSRVSYGVHADGIDAGGYSLRDLSDFFGIDIGETSMSSEVGVNGWSFRAFGGISLNLFVLRIDLTALYNFRDRNFGGTVGLRIQI